MLNEETRKLIRGLEKGKSLEYLEFISTNISRLRKLLDSNGGKYGNEIFPVR